VSDNQIKRILSGGDIEEATRKVEAEFAALNDIRESLSPAEYQRRLSAIRARLVELPNVQSARVLPSVERR
jgi:hypothetical protein